MERVAPYRIFPEQPVPVVGMVHLPALPGSPGWGGSMETVLDQALRDGQLLEEGGVDGLLVENFGDEPYVPERVAPETAAAMARATMAVVDATSLPVGVNVLRNDARTALGVAVAAGARFIRVNVHAGVMVTDQGVLEGRAHETLRIRRSLDADVAILADVLVKHAVPPPGLAPEQAARDVWHRGRADALVVSGSATGSSTEPAILDRVRAAVPEAPVWVGSGASPETVAELLPRCDGLVVGSALQADGRAGSGVILDRVRALMDAVSDVGRGT